MSLSAIPGRVRPSDALALVLLGATFAASILAYDVVPAEMIVHYTPPGGVYYGPETLPKAIGLFVIPVVSTLTFAVLRAIPIVDEVAAHLEPARSVYQAGILIAVGSLGVGQMVLILLNTM